MDKFNKAIGHHPEIVPEFIKSVFFVCNTCPDNWQAIMRDVGEGDVRNNVKKKIDDFISNNIRKAEQIANANLISHNYDDDDDDDEYDDNTEFKKLSISTWNSAISMLPDTVATDVMKEHGGVVNALISRLKGIPKQREIIERSWNDKKKLEAYLTVYSNKNFRSLWHKNICPHVKGRTLKEATEFRITYPLINQDLLTSIATKLTSP